MTNPGSRTPELRAPRGLSDLGRPTNSKPPIEFRDRLSHVSMAICGQGVVPREAAFRGCTVPRQEIPQHRSITRGISCFKKIYCESQTPIPLWQASTDYRGPHEASFQHGYCQAARLFRLQAEAVSPPADATSLTSSTTPLIRQIQFRSATNTDRICEPLIRYLLPWDAILRVGASGSLSKCKLALLISISASFYGEELFKPHHVARPI
jgi:hypothetical protein